MLTKETYFDKANELKYFGSTQFKSFMKCEAAAMAEINGEYERPKTDALLVGSYVDAHFSGELDLFKTQNPEIFTKAGELKSQYKQAEEIINYLEHDEMFMRYMSGEQQVIKTGKLFGHDFKIKIDSYHPGKAIVDLKIMRDFEPVYTPELGRTTFVYAWGYDIQGAIYQAVEGNNLPFIIAAATKQKDGPDKGLFQIPQHKLDGALKMVEYFIDHFADVKAGSIEPKRCEKCPYCRATKQLKRIEILEVANE